MSKTVTLPWNGKTRQIEIVDPGKAEKIRLYAISPEMLSLNAKSLQWLHQVIGSATDFSPKTSKNLPLDAATKLVNEILLYWSEEENRSKDYRYEPENDPLNEMELNDNGSVDIEEMR